jgi:integrase
MKHITKRKTKLYFQRGIPTRLRPIAGKSSFSMPLGLDDATATEEERLHARIEAQRMYELYLKTLENSSADAYAENEIDLLAADVLRRNRVNAGQYAKHMLGPKLQENDPDLADLPQELTSQDYATLAVPEYLNQYLRWQEAGDLDDQGSLKRDLSAQEEATIRAWEAVQKVSARKPKTLDSLWAEYLKMRRGVDVTSREGKRTQGRWNKFRQHCADVVVSKETPDLLEEALDTFVDTELAKGNKISSIQRDMNEIIGCFNWSNKFYRLQWRPVQQRPLDDLEPSKQKQVLTLEQQSLLLTSALKANTADAAALLLMLQCGGMATEIARLRIDEDLFLKHQYPYIALLGGVNTRAKTKERLRFAPIVFGLNLIKAKLPEAIQRLSVLVDPATALTNELRRLLESNDFSSHCLRHTFRLNAQNALANPMVTMTIAGWSGEKINRVAVDYGAQGFGNSESLKILHKEQVRIFKHLIKLESQIVGLPSNVLHFSGDSK